MTTPSYRRQNGPLLLTTGDKNVLYSFLQATKWYVTYLDIALCRKGRRRPKQRRVQDPVAVPRHAVRQRPLRQ
jgi:hypothetical protein